MSNGAAFTFRRHGRAHHLRIASAEDLRRVLELDEAHWVATGAPIETLNVDDDFLRLLDSDANGRVLCVELAAAIRWLLDVFSDTSGVDARNDSLRLAAINEQHADGARIAISLRRMLEALGQDETGAVTLEQIRQIRSGEQATPVSAAGVVLPQAARDEPTRAFLQDVLATVGGVDHPGGSRGVDAAKLEQFLSDARAYLNWRAGGRLLAGQAASAVLPFGADTAEAFAAVRAVRDKLEQYFSQCRLAEMNPALAAAMYPGVSAEAASSAAGPERIEAALAAAPLAPPNADGVLDLSGPLNPYYAPAVEALRRKALTRILGPVDTLSRAQWRQVKASLAPYEVWLNSKVGAAVEPLGAEKLRAYLDGRFAESVRTLIERSGQTAFDVDNIRLAEKACLYQANMLALANNYVSFPDFYDPQGRALFDMGNLVMDGRRFNFAIRVTDRAEHAKLVRTSNIFTLYLAVAPYGGGAGFEVAVPVTSGGKGNLCVGKRGLFVGEDGTQYDAKVLEIIENPISLAEAFWAPFQRIGRLITGKIEALATDAEKKLDQTTTTAVTQVRAGGQQPAEQTRPAGLSGGVLMGGGLAIAALGSALAYITKTLAGLKWYTILIGILVAAAAVILPTSIVAFVRLRRRDLSAILEGSGWAVNARMRLTYRQSRYFTQRPDYPPGARGVVRRKWWIWLIVGVLAAVLAAGVVYAWVGATPASSTMQPTTQPAK